jgi:hypothetical protein
MIFDEELGGGDDLELDGTSRGRSRKFAKSKGISVQHPFATITILGMMHN